MSPQEQSKTVPVYVCCLEGISPKAVVYDYAAASECLDCSVPPSDWYEPSNEWVLGGAGLHGTSTAQQQGAFPTKQQALSWSLGLGKLGTKGGTSKAVTSPFACTASLL